MARADFCVNGTMSENKVIAIIRDVLNEMEAKVKMRQRNHEVTLWCVVCISLLALATAIVAICLVLYAIKTDAERYQHNNRVHQPEAMNAPTRAITNAQRASLLDSTETARDFSATPHIDNQPQKPLTMSNDDKRRTRVAKDSCVHRTRNVFVRRCEILSNTGRVRRTYTAHERGVRPTHGNSFGKEATRKAQAATYKEPPATNREAIESTKSQHSRQSRRTLSESSFSRISSSFSRIVASRSIAAMRSSCRFCSPPSLTLMSPDIPTLSTPQASNFNPERK